MARIRRDPSTRGERATPRRLRPSPAMAVALLALCVAIGGVAVAAIPGPGGVIKGCYDPSSSPQHPLSVVDDDGDCRSPNVLLPFNQQGPQGPQGTAGPAGPPGPAGAGVAYTTTSLLPTIPLGAKTKTIATLSVPVGKYVVIAKANVQTHDFDEIAGHLGGKPLSKPEKFASCKLTGGGTDGAQVGVTDEVVADGLAAVAGGSKTTMTLITTPEFPPRAGGTAEIRLKCTGEAPGPTDSIYLKRVRLTAIAVGTLVTQSALKLSGGARLP